jgi:methionyl-tRNA synthetase
VDEQALQAKLEASEMAMGDIANKTLSKVQRAVGLRPLGREQKKSVKSDKSSIISLEDFAKLDLKIGQVINARAIEESDKLIELIVDLGTERRTIVTGMREFYEPESFIGKRLPIVANLQPHTFRGATSHGMLMAVEGKDGPVLLLPEHQVPAGSTIR